MFSLCTSVSYSTIMSHTNATRKVNRNSSKHHMKIRIPAPQKQDTSWFCGQLLHASFLRLLQLSLFTFCFFRVFATLHSPALPQVLSPSICSDFLSSLLSCLWQTLCWTQPEPSSALLFPGSLSLSRSVVQRATAKAVPLPLFLSVSPFPLHPDCAKHSFPIAPSHTHWNKIIMKWNLHTTNTHTKCIDAFQLLH